ncbi:MAG: hypothetical protein JO048_06640, partial [Methylobacteriaceae bacterium]|nr:hypothetical protein [Methylobacteriaceae bacterium]
MGDITADPTSLADLARQLRPGDTLKLQPGRYTDELSLRGLGGTQDRPITIRGEPGAVFDGGRTATDYREEGNRRAIDAVKQGGYPGLWPFMSEAMISVERCSHLVLDGFTVRRAWPSALYLGEAQSITLRNLGIEDATFAIGAAGASTSDILIENVRWCQDVSRDWLWRRIAWESVHGEQPVDVARDWRLFDGDFVRGFGIRGGVTIRNCTVEHAFNAVHAFNDNLDPALSQDFSVHDCSFAYIRDNVFEPEGRSSNWWFYRNRIRNAHKPFSIEGSASSYLYLFSNVVWFDEVPGQPGQDNRAGGLFKLAKTQGPDAAGQYVFNNSVAARSDYMRKGTLRGLRHWANAIRF